jgi:AcrR family transcriptional regulator
MADKPYRTRIAVRVLEVAERILETEGLPGLQARRIAKESDCAVGTLYNIFGDIDGLIIAANARTLHAFGRRAEAAMQRASGGSLEERLMALALTYLDFAIAHRLRLKAVFDHQLADPEGEVSASYLSDQARLFALIETPLEPFIGDLAARANAARAMFAAVHGIVAMAIDRKLGPFNAQATERQVRFVVEAMAKGVRG